MVGFDTQWKRGGAQRFGDAKPLSNEVKHASVLQKGNQKNSHRTHRDEKVVAFVRWISGGVFVLSGVFFHHVLFSFNPSLVSFFFSLFLSSLFCFISGV